jgi:hypothetical protein
MFEDYTVLVLQETPGASDIVETLQKHGATAKQLPNPTIDQIAHEKFNHIISPTSNFPAYIACRRALIPVTTPEWVWESLRSSKPCMPNKFTPDSHLFMKDVFVCVADNLPRGDKEAIYGGVAAFGGHYLDDLTKYTTHLVATDMRNVKSIIAANVIHTPDENGHTIDIKIVTPRWIDACLSLGKLVDELDFLLNGLSEPEIQVEVPISRSGPIANRTVYCAYTSPLLTDLLKHHGAVVRSEYDPTVDIYLGPHKSGSAYEAAAQSIHTVIGTLPWIYSVLASNKWHLPSNLLHSPIPLHPPPDFAGLKISITNYSGEARTYLAKLIVGLGAEFTKTLTRSNNYLIAGSPHGKKYLTATERWLDADGRPTIKVVNHVWLEECYASWSLVDDNDPSYLPGTAIPLGSVHEDEDIITQSSQTPQASPQTPITSPGDTKEKQHRSNGQATPSSTNEAVHIPAEDTPQSETKSARKSRSAAQKAAQKLHADMNDLNDYQKMAKSSRMMKTYMETLDAQTPAKRQVEAERATESPPPKKKKAATHINAIITGSEDEITLTRLDLAKLTQVGIKVNKELTKAHRVEVIIAPRILRTEKFLTSLSQADKIIHPQYLIDLLKVVNESSTWEEVSKQFKMEDYSLDKVITTKEVNKDLGVSGNVNGLLHCLNSANKGLLFKDMQLNLSTNLNGGVSVVEAILGSHGLKHHTAIKTLTRKAQLMGDRPILVAHATKDKKLVSSFKRLCPDGTVVTWDWCVRSIFAMELVDYEPYTL